MHYPALKAWALSLAVIFSLLTCSSSLSGRSNAARRRSCAVRIRSSGVGGRNQQIADVIAERNGFRNLGKIGNLEDMYLFEAVSHSRQWAISVHTRGEQKRRSLLSQTEQLESDEHVDYILEQVVQRRAKRSVYSPPLDPLWPRQWSLLNEGQEAVGGEYDLNVEPAWIQGLTGRGVTVAVTDDGLWYSHPDLTANFRSKLSWDFIDNDGDVMPRRNRENHGTSCAGVIAMTRNNGMCGTGIAYEAQIAGLRMLDGDDTTDAIEASALGFANQYIHIHSSSWGPYDNGFTVGGPGPILTNVLRRGAEEGRGGKGVVYVWASGNGGKKGDTCAMDGYVSSIYTVAVGSIDQYGVQAPFDEDCTGKLAVAVNHNADSHNSQVVTTDNRNRCRGNFKGTSAAAPLVAGIIALTLQANGNLTWRDVQYLIVHTSRHGGLTTPREPKPWRRNGAGLWVSHHFGFGAIDAEAMVTRARHWTNVPEQRQATYFPHIGHGTVAANSSLQAVFSVESNKTEINSLEHVVLQLSLTIENYTSPRSLAQYHIMQSLFGTHFDQADINMILEHEGARRGDVKISLTSPSGTESTLLPHRKKDFVNTGTLDLSFMSVQHWGENPVGRWTLAVCFNSSEGYVRLSGVNVTLYGISESSVESVSEECDSECRGKCARDGPSYCDRCLHYRDRESLTCLPSCNATGSSSRTSYQVRGGYCILQPTHTSSSLLVTSSSLLVTTSKVSIPPTGSETQYSNITPTETRLYTNTILQPNLNHLHSSTQMYTNHHNLAAPLSKFPLPGSKFSTDSSSTTSRNQGATLRQTHDVMMTSSLILPNQASVSLSLRPSPAPHRLTHTLSSTVVVESSDRETKTCTACSAAISALVSSTNFLVMFCLAFMSCFYV